MQIKLNHDSLVILSEVQSFRNVQTSLEWQLAATTLSANCIQSKTFLFPSFLCSTVSSCRTRFTFLSQSYMRSIAGRTHFHRYSDAIFVSSASPRPNDTLNANIATKFCCIFSNLILMGPSHLDLDDYPVDFMFRLQ